LRCPVSGFDLDFVRRYHRHIDGTSEVRIKEIVMKKTLKFIDGFFNIMWWIVKLPILILAWPMAMWIYRANNSDTEYALGLDMLRNALISALLTASWIMYLLSLTGIFDAPAP
jgi:hypothetical protein